VPTISPKQITEKASLQLNASRGVSAKAAFHIPLPTGFPISAIYGIKGQREANDICTKARKNKIKQEKKGAETRATYGFPFYYLTPKAAYVMASKLHSPYLAEA